MLCRINIILRQCHGVIILRHTRPPINPNFWSIGFFEAYVQEILCGKCGAFVQSVTIISLTYRTIIFSENTSQYEFTYPIAIYNGEEDYNFLKRSLEPIINSMKSLQENGYVCIVKYLCVQSVCTCVYLNLLYFIQLN